MTRSARILLGDILEAAELLERYTAGLSRQEFAGNIEKQDAVARRLEIIGESVKRLPRDLRDQHPTCRGAKLLEHGTSSFMSTSESTWIWRGRW